jgi:hypothetical protein
MRPSREIARHIVDVLGIDHMGARAAEIIIAAAIDDAEKRGAAAERVRLAALLQGMTLVCVDNGGAEASEIGKLMRAREKAGV